MARSAHQLLQLALDSAEIENPAEHYAVKSIFLNGWRKDSEGWVPFSWIAKELCEKRAGGDYPTLEASVEAGILVQSQEVFFGIGANRSQS